MICHEVETYAQLTEVDSVFYCLFFLIFSGLRRHSRNANQTPLSPRFCSNDHCELMKFIMEGELLGLDPGVKQLQGQIMTC